MTAALNFIYHSNTENGNFVKHPNPYHVGGVNGATDFGAGFYLSDDLNGSYLWGARHEFPDYGTLNVYDISPQILSLNHLVLTDSYEDILCWAMTTGFYLGYYPRSIASARVGKLEDLYTLNADDYHWILSRRTDDKMFSYIGSFFDGALSFQGLVECYDRLSFGDELVLKSQEAIDCLDFSEQYSGVFDKTPYKGRYQALKEQSDASFDVILLEHSCSQSGEPGVAEIIDFIENDIDWTQHV